MPLASTIESAALRRSARMATVLEEMPVRDAAQLRNWLLDPDVDGDRKDEALLRAVILGSEIQEATLLVVYCLLPGLAGLARRFRTFDQDEVWSELVAGLVDRIHRYDSVRRPRRVAANLLLDALAATCRWTAKESKAQRIRPVEVVQAESVEASSLSPVEEGVRHGVISAPDAGLITATRMHGVPLGDMAVLLGLQYEAAKKRRRRAELTLMRWWSAVDAVGQPAEAA